MCQVAAKRLKADASEYKRSPIVETAKRVADMWLEMAQLIRSELFHFLKLHHTVATYIIMISYIIL